MWVIWASAIFSENKKKKEIVKLLEIKTTMEIKGKNEPTRVKKKKDNGYFFDI